MCPSVKNSDCLFHSLLGVRARACHRPAPSLGGSAGQPVVSVHVAKYTECLVAGTPCPLWAKSGPRAQLGWHRIGDANDAQSPSYRFETMILSHGQQP
jgi:hypothetical protein